jgi:hypothetical protein
MFQTLKLSNQMKSLKMMIRTITLIIQEFYNIEIYNVTGKKYPESLLDHGTFLGIQF